MWFSVFPFLRCLNYAMVIILCYVVVSSYYCHKRDMLESRLRSDLLSGS